MRRFTLLALLASASVPAAGATLTLTAATDLRERGLSLSDGRAAGRATLGQDLGALFATTSVSTARGAARFGGAEAVIDGSLSRRFFTGAFFADAALFGRAFPGGRGGFGYAEAYAGAGARLAIAEVDLSYAYAPRQSALGGDNHYARARTRLAVVGTPFTLIAHIGRSTGHASDPLRAARIRPAGRYVDWGISVDHVRGPLTLRLAYSDTNIDDRTTLRPFADSQHNGARIAAQASFQL